MSTVLAPGANAPIAQTKLSVTFTTGQLPNGEIDMSAFLVTASGKVRSDEDMCFYGQKSVEQGAVSLASSQTGQTLFDLDLSRLPAAIEKIVFTATIHENRATFGALREITYQTTAGPQGAIPCAGRDESAMLIAEVYLRNGQWKIRTIGQGFVGGLLALAMHMGVDIADTPAPAPVPVQPSKTPVVKKAPPVSLKKISLTKENRTVSLKKATSDFGAITVNLNWNQKPKNTGLLGGIFGAKALDLDLACFIEDRSGHKAIVQALGNSFGDFNGFPFVRLRGDDRTGAVTDGEWLDINGHKWSEIKRLLIFAFIYQGAPNWQETDGVVRVTIPDQPEIEVRMNEYGSTSGMCAVLALENVDGQIEASREVKFFDGHERMDQEYNWGMRWTTARK
jgi:tellurite resistance protein TerA